MDVNRTTQQDHPVPGGTTPRSASAPWLGKQMETDHPKLKNEQTARDGAFDDPPERIS